MTKNSLAQTLSERFAHACTGLQCADACWSSGVADNPIEWHRLHRLEPPVTLRVVASPISGDWLVRVDGWEFPEQFPLLYDSLESAQHASDDVLINYQPHDCRQVGCGEWVPVKVLGQSGPVRPM